MTRKQHRSAIRRALAIMLATVSVAGGMTFAALQGQGKLTGNTVQTATANLQLSTDGSNYAATQAGFSFLNIVPGGSPVPQYGNNVFLKNTGGTPLGLKLAATSTPSNPDNVDLSKVIVTLTLRDSSTPQTFSLQSLLAPGGVAINLPAQLTAGNTVQYSMQVSMAADAVTGSSASLANIDFSFTGTL